MTQISTHTTHHEEGTLGGPFTLLKRPECNRDSQLADINSSFLIGITPEAQNTYCRTG